MMVTQPSFDANTNNVISACITHHQQHTVISDSAPGPVLPTVSRYRSLYMMVTQPSLDANTNSVISACITQHQQPTTETQSHTSSAVFARLTSVPDTQRDRQRDHGPCDMCNESASMQGLIIMPGMSDLEKETFLDRWCCNTAVQNEQKTQDT